MNRYEVYCESEHYAGHGEHYVVEAETEDEADEIARQWAEDDFYEQDYDQLVEEYGADYADDVCYATVMWVRLIDKNDYDDDRRPSEAQEWYPFDPEC